MMETIESILSGTMRMSTPLIFAAIGGMFSERSGVVNIALEGLMLFSAFSAAVITLLTHNPYFGVIAAILTGIIVSAIHAVVSIDFKGDQIVSGTAINILAFGVPPLFCKMLFDVTGTTPNIPFNDRFHVFPIPYLEKIPILGEALFKQTPLVYLAIIVVVLSYYVLYKTPFGLHIRSCGEDPSTVTSVGLSVRALRYKGVLLSGAIVSLGGAFLSIGHASYFTRGMTAGRGFIALAALILGKWMPFRTLFACLLFGFADILQIRLQGVSFPYFETVPVQFIQMIPYVITILILVGFIGRSIPPASIGKPYERD